MAIPHKMMRSGRAVTFITERLNDSSDTSLVQCGKRDIVVDSMKGTDNLPPPLFYLGRRWD